MHSDTYYTHQSVPLSYTPSTLQPNFHYCGVSAPPGLVAFTAAGTVFPQNDAGANKDVKSMASTAAAANELSTSFTFATSPSTDDSWVKEAEAHFASIAPPPSSTVIDSNIMTALTCRNQQAACHPDYPWLPASFVDPVPEKHKERLRRAMTRNIEFVLRKDVEERQKVIDALSSDVGGNIESISGPDISRPGAKHIRRHKLLGQERRTGGIGSVDAPAGPRDSRQTVCGQGFEANTAVYVTGLPSTVTWDQLHQLFSPYGRVRRIKIYRTFDEEQPIGDGTLNSSEEVVSDGAASTNIQHGKTSTTIVAAAVLTTSGAQMAEAPSYPKKRTGKGVPKGDALITYVKPGSAATAVKKLNGVDISNSTNTDIRKLSVQPADFSHKDEQQQQQQCYESYKKENEASMNDVKEYRQASDVQPAVPSERTLNPSLFDKEGVPLFQPLPSECCASSHPTCVLRNLYTVEQISQQPDQEHFLNSLEAEILMECLKFGSVICCMTLPEAPYYHGAVLVSFGACENASGDVIASTATIAQNEEGVSDALEALQQSSAVMAAQACGEAMDGRLFDGLTIKVQALGNWGEGEIIPREQLSRENDQTQLYSDKEEEAAVAAAIEAEIPALDEFFSGLL